MNNSLLNFIAVRRAEIRKDLGALTRELAELDTAENAITKGKSGRGKPLTRHILSPEATPTQEQDSDKTPTIQTMAVAVLTNRPKGANAVEIVGLIQERFGADVPRTSLSPQLSRLKKDGKLTMRAKTWRLVANKDEAPDAATSGASKGGGGSSPSNERRKIDDLLA